MTAADTPSREAVLFALMDAHRNFMATGANRPSEGRWDDMTDAVIELYRLARLAAKPADDGVRIPYDEDAKLGYVWLIWGLTTDRMDLIAIATTEEACARYLEAGKLMNRYRAVKEEQAFVDHLYGGGMLKAFTNARLPLSTKAKP